ncbi:MAG TPA: hypothetical protein VEQ63_01905, partial [Bryobacteraceae bacterium]|nr:hypothetical protein [Bryobacteraceae bacterium]
MAYLGCEFPRKTDKALEGVVIFLLGISASADQYRWFPTHRNDAPTTQLPPHLGLAAGVVTVFVHTDRFADGPQYFNAGTHTLAYSTDWTQEIMRCTLDALERIFREGFNYRKADVMLNSLSPADQLTLRMFGDEKAEKFRQVMVAVEQINRKSGRDTIRFGRRTQIWIIKNFLTNSRATI